MLYYLDNYVNTWPYPNENYAREVLELHTLGAVENYYGSVDPTSLEDNDYGQRTGYTEIDVFEFAKALTGWGVSDGQYETPETGEFLFRPDRHYDDWEEAPIQVMDAPALTGPGGESDVTDILDYLAGHYGTARYVCWKLCTRLIGDNPPDSIVNTAALEFFNRRNEGSQLKEVYRTILTSPEFKSTWGSKVKRPIETLIRAMRGADVDFTIRVDESVSNSVFGRLDDTGQYPFGYTAPTGYPDESVMWTGSGPLIMSWRTVTYMLRRGEVVNFAEQTNGGISDPDERTPVKIVDFWMNRVLGYAMDASVTAKLVEFVVDTAGVEDDEPVPSHPMSSTYKKILRGLVGLILMSPDSMKR